MSLIKFSYEHIPLYVLFYLLVGVLFLVDVQIMTIYFNLNLLMIFTLSSIYYWAIYNPKLIPIPLLFTLGLLKDLLTGMPFIGLSAFLFILVAMMTKQQRVFLSGQSFFMIWAGYILVTFLSCFIFWIFLCIKLVEFAPFFPYLIEGAMMILSFPIILSLTGALHKLLPFAPHDKTSL